MNRSLSLRRLRRRLVAVSTSALFLLGGPVASAQDVSPDGAQPNEHPLAPAYRLAREGLDRIQNGDQARGLAPLAGYTCTLVKRERVKGTLNDHQYIFIKVRHQPFSVYMNFLKPADIKGRDVIWVKGQNNGKLLAREKHGLGARFGMVKLVPTSMIAMKGQRYPIYMTGVQNLIQELIKVAQNDMQFGECEVKFYNGTKINGRVCTCIQVVHPKPRKQFRFHLARIFIDDELQVPIRFEAYSWPKKQGGRPVPEEEYTYLNMKLNPGLTDVDFDYRNPGYGFVKRNR